MSNDIGPQLRAVLDDLAGVVGHIAESQAHDPTPCAEMDVSALRDHVVGWLTAFGEGAVDSDGKAGDVHTGAPSGDPVAAIRTAADRFDAGIADGALERDFYLGESSLPGTAALSMILWEYQMHGWDLARATGQAWDPPADGVEASLAFAPNMLTPDFQGDGKSFGPPVPVPDDAPAFARLLGLSGRDPEWAHSSGTRPS